MTTITQKSQKEEAGEKLTGRVAFVTGGTRGIGRAIALSLASQGATIAAGYGQNEERAKEFLAEVEPAKPSRS